MRISELAEQAGVPTSTVRYYERIGLVGPPARTPSGYRDYGEAEATRLQFVSRARRMGLSCEQIVELLPVLTGSDCSGAQKRVLSLLEEKRAEILERIAELRAFAAQLDAVRATLEATPALPVCRTDLACCVPSGPDSVIPVELVTRRRKSAAVRQR